MSLYAVDLQISSDFRIGLVSRGHGRESVVVTAAELPEFLRLLAAAPTPATLQDWFTRNLRQAA